ncbi:MAG: hypothetical protein A4E53_01326 [Pelotomaculum sp. PtaB.Bin104]|nr:MAG: hypothetical protein A4E53_01326 [Pelotomaculum sp. PtaB.Bin104]
MLYSIILIIIAVGLFYLVYRILKADQDVVLEILKYIIVVLLLWLAVCSIVAALRYVVF